MIAAGLRRRSRQTEAVMELRKVWFPLVLAAFWVVFSAVALNNFATFSGTTRAGSVPAVHAAATPADGDAAQAG